MATVKKIVFRGGLTERRVVCEGRVADIGFTGSGLILTIAADSNQPAYDIELSTPEFADLVRRASADPV